MYLNKYLFSMVAALVLTGCGGGSSDESPTEVNKITQENTQGELIQEEIIQNTGKETPQVTSIEAIDYSTHASHAFHQLRLAEHLSYIAKFTENHIISGEPNPSQPNGQLKVYNDSCVKLPEGTTNHFDTSGDITSTHLILEFTGNCRYFGTGLKGAIAIVINSFNRMNNLELSYSISLEAFEVDHLNDLTEQTMKVSGDIEVDYELNLVGETLQITSSNLSYEISENSYDITNWELTKNFDYLTALYELSLHGDITSDDLKSDFTVTTTTPLMGTMLHVPTKGQIEVEGLYNPIKITSVTGNETLPVNIEFYIDSENKYLATQSQVEWNDIINLSLFTSFETQSSLFNFKTGKSSPVIYAAEPFQYNETGTFIDKRLGAPGSINVLWEGESFIECKNTPITTSYPANVYATNTDLEKDGNSYPFTVTVSGACLIVSPPSNLPNDNFYEFNQSVIDIFQLKYVSKP